MSHDELGPDAGGFSASELDAQEAAQLPDREAMSVLAPEPVFEPDLGPIVEPPEGQSPSEPIT